MLYLLKVLEKIIPFSELSVCSSNFFSLVFFVVLQFYDIFACCLSCLCSKEHMKNLATSISLHKETIHMSYQSCHKAIFLSMCNCAGQYLRFFSLSLKPLNIWVYYI